MGLKDLPGYNSLVIPYHVAKAVVAGVKYKWPGKRLRVIGVTGTNGKTTTAFMIWKILNESGRKAGLMTTVAWGCLGMSGDSGGADSAGSSGDSGGADSAGLVDADGLHKQIEHMTTADSMTLNRRIKAIADAGAEFLVLEVTSHALAQYRTLGVPIEIAVMTNISHEHLDYHKTMERYIAAKCKLFKKAKFGVINGDDKEWAKFAEAIEGERTEDVEGEAGAIWSAEVRKKKLGLSGEKYITYGASGDLAAVVAEKVELGAEGVSYEVSSFKELGSLKIRTQIPGKFNVSNSLAAVCVGEKLGLSKEEIERGVYALETVEGRMNKVKVKGQNFTVVVDFAHTPDAFEKVFESVCGTSGASRDAEASGGSDNAQNSGVSRVKKRRVIALTGGAGRRDESTREERGEIMGRYADVAIITEDDSRDEDPAKIAEAFVAGAEKVGLKRGKVSAKERKSGRFEAHQREVLVELDRKKAIRLAVSMAKRGDLVLLLGKGHEKTILRKDGAHKFEDLKVAREALEERFS